MEKYDILDKARKSTAPYSKVADMCITTLDPDAPYPLRWDVKLEIPEIISIEGNAGGYVFDFLINFNSLLLDVSIKNQTEKAEGKKYEEEHKNDCRKKDQGNPPTIRS